MACECIKFRTVAYDSTPYDSDARPGYPAERATPGDLGRILAKAGTATLIPGDEPPEGWPDSHG